MVATIHCVSSGVIVAALVSNALAHGHSLRAHYEDLLAGHATHGWLPSLPQSRRLVAEYIERESPGRCADGPPIIALGVRRSTYQPLLIDLRICHRADILEALMSIPFVVDSAASRRLHIIDGGFERNTPHHIMPTFGQSVVLSHFAPKGSYPDSYDQLPLARWMSRGPLRHPSRLLWACINSTFPHAPQQHIPEWIYPRHGCALHFFSRSLAQHLSAIRQGVEDTEAWLTVHGPIASAADGVSRQEAS